MRVRFHTDAPTNDNVTEKESERREKTNQYNDEHRSKAMKNSTFKDLIVFSCLWLSQFFFKSPWSSRYCVGLLDAKSGFEYQARHKSQIQKGFLRRFPLSRFLAKM